MIGRFVCKHKTLIIVISVILLFLSFIGMYKTKINYDILVYLPGDIETIKGQKILTNDFNLGSYSISIIENMESKDILELEDKIRDIDGVSEVVSLYDVLGTTIPVEILPDSVSSKMHNEDTDLLLITFENSTSNEATINAVSNIREVTEEKVSQGGMSSMVLDTMNLSEKEIMTYIVIAVILCTIILEVTLDSYLVPFILLINIGFAIMFNMGTNIFLGQISYITKALVAVLQLGVTTDFSIFLYHSYEKKKNEFKDRTQAMSEAIKETTSSITGSSLTTIVGFLALCTMQLTLGMDLGIVMAKGVFLGVITVLTLFPSLLLFFDKLITRTKHKTVIPKFHSLNEFIVKKRRLVFILFLVLLIPFYLANSKVFVYYKLDSSLPDTLESVKTNKYLKENYNLVSPEIILIDKDLKTETVNELTHELENIPGIDFAKSFAEVKNLGITEDMVPLSNILENDTYQIILVNSLYDIATDELNEQTTIINETIKKYDDKSILAGEGPLMKDLVNISDTDFNNVNIYSIICVLIVLCLVLRSIKLPVLLVITIEFAIITNMSISYFSGVTLPFIAPIVLGTIQLGATIDYAILLTTTYIKKRKTECNSDKAMVDTLDYTSKSIVTSALCFFAATFGVGIYSDIEMIGSICNLISRGAIISMGVVIIILPSVLILFDKLIIRKDDLCEKNK